MNFRAFQPNFSKGVIAPELYARFDADMYHAGLKVGKNVVLMKYGGITKRMGTHFVAEALSGTTQRLVPFQFSLGQSYVLEFGHNYMAPIALGGRVTSGGSPYSIASPYPAASVPDFDYEQTTDTVYIAHLDHPPQKLTRAGHTSWSFAAVTFGPAISPPASATTTAVIANTDVENDGLNYFPEPANYAVTTYNPETGQESRPVFTPAPAINDLTLKKNRNTINYPTVGPDLRYNIYKSDNSQFYGYIGVTFANQFIDNNIAPALDRAPPNAYNPFSGANNYPSTVTMFEQRSVWARTRNIPNGIWLSRSGQPENMDKSTPLVASDSITFGIAAGRVNSVNQLASTSGLLALASDSLFSVEGGGDQGILTGNSPPTLRRHIAHGASRLKPLIIDNVVFYVPALGSTVRTMNYSFEADGMKSSNMTIFSPHFFAEGADALPIVSWCYAQEPWSVIWAVRSDGKLLAFTWEQEQQVWGWTEIETDGLVRSVCAINEDGQDFVYLVVERTWGGVTKRFIERMASPLWDDVSTSVFMDCAISATFGTPRSTFTGLDHLNGRTDVCGIVDGVAVTGLTVTGGSLTLPPEVGSASVVSFGIPYEVHVETLPVRMTSQGVGANVGRNQQTGDAVIMVKDTRGIMAGIDKNNLYMVKTRTNEAYGSPDRPMNGEYVIPMANKAGTEINVCVKQNLPLPLTILGIGRDLVMGG